MYFKSRWLHNLLKSLGKSRLIHFKTLFYCLIHFFRDPQDYEFQEWRRWLASTQCGDVPFPEYWQSANPGESGHEWWCPRWSRWISWFLFRPPWHRNYPWGRRCISLWRVFRLRRMWAPSQRPVSPIAHLQSAPISTDRRRSWLPIQTAGSRCGDIPARRRTLVWTFDTENSNSILE